MSVFVKIEMIFYITIIFSFLWKIDAGFICPINGENYPVGNDCKSFYDCSNGSPVIKSCPDNQFWDCSHQFCTWTTMRECCSSTDESIYRNDLNSRTCSNGTMWADPINQTRFFNCDNDILFTFSTQIYESSCDLGKTFCPASLNCYEPSKCDKNATQVPYSNTFFVAGEKVNVTNQPFCFGRNYLSSVISNCSLYLNCTNDKPYLYECPAGFVYDCFNKKCSIKTSKFCCPDDPNNNSTVSSIYYKCSAKVNSKVYFNKSNLVYNGTSVCINNTIYTPFCGNDSQRYCPSTGRCYDPSNEICGVQGSFCPLTLKQLFCCNNNRSWLMKFFLPVLKYFCNQTICCVITSNSRES